MNIDQSVMCYIYQWICLDKHYKLMENFFKFRISFQIIGQKPKKYSTNKQSWVYANIIELNVFFRQWLICADQHAF